MTNTKNENGWNIGRFKEWIYIPSLKKWVFIEICEVGEYELFNFNGEKCLTPREINFRQRKAKAELEELERIPPVRIIL